MATKANAHYVDCDINPDRLSWECEGAEAVTTYTLTYFSQSGALWGVPLGDKEMLGTLDSGGVAVDVGGGVVGLPYAGHPFAAGDTVRISNTTSYDGAYTVEASTTSTQIDITHAYIAETFSGDEIVVRYVLMDIGVSRMSQDPDGVLYYGAGWEAAEEAFIQTYDPDTQTLAWDSLPWSAQAKSTNGDVWGICFTTDGNYLYVVTGDSAQNVSKFQLSDNSLLWSRYDTQDPSYSYAVDSSGRLYGLFTAKHDNPMQQLSADGSTVTELTNMGQRVSTAILGNITHCTVTDDTLELVIGGGWMYTLAGWFESVKTQMYNIGVRTYDNSEGATLRLGDYDNYGTLKIGNGQIVTDGTYIYVCLVTSSTTTTLYKLQYSSGSLNIIASSAGPSYGVSLYFDAYGNLVVVNKNGGSNEDSIYYYDTDLVLQGHIDGFYDQMLSLWDPGAGWLWLRGSAEADGVVAGGSSGRAAQVRALWYPSDWSHLNGESVQVLGDGAYLGTETVASGIIALDDDTTTNHVGLAYTSYLQPMKPDGEVYVKGISEILLQLYNTLGGKYGETLARFWQIIFRDRDDDFGDSSALFSGYKRLPFDGSYTRKGDLWIVQDIPLPMTVLGIIAKMELNDGSR